MRDFLFVQNGREYIKLPFSEILYVEALKNYMRIVTTKRKYVIKKTMKEVEASLPPDQFCRIHRSYIVSIGAITSFNLTRIYIQELYLPVSKGYRKSLLKQITPFNYNAAQSQLVQAAAMIVSIGGLI